MISSKTNYQLRPDFPDSALRSWQGQPLQPGRAHDEGASGLECLAAARRLGQLVHYRVIRVERTTNGEPVAMERYAAKDPMSAVESARNLQAEGAGGIAFLLLDHNGGSSPIKEIIAVFGLQPEEAKQLLVTG
jgi:hypothetical protein